MITIKSRHHHYLTRSLLICTILSLSLSLSLSLDLLYRAISRFCSRRDPQISTNHYDYLFFRSHVLSVSLKEKKIVFYNVRMIAIVERAAADGARASISGLFRPTLNRITLLRSKRVALADIKAGGTLIRRFKREPYALIYTWCTATMRIRRSPSQW